MQQPPVQPPPQPPYRKLDLFAMEHFGGDTVAALKHVMQNGHSITEFVPEMTKLEARETLKYAFYKTAEKYGGWDKVEHLFTLAYTINQYCEKNDITRKELETNKKNPFWKKLRTPLVEMAVAIFVPILSLLLLRRFTNASEDVLKAVGIIQSSFISLAAINMVYPLFAAIKFKRMKRKAILLSQLEDEMEAFRKANNPASTQSDED